VLLKPDRERSIVGKTAEEHHRQVRVCVHQSRDGQSTACFNDLVAFRPRSIGFADAINDAIRDADGREPGVIESPDFP